MSLVLHVVSYQLGKWLWRIYTKYWTFVIPYDNIYGLLTFYCSSLAVIHCHHFSTHLPMYSLYHWIYIHLDLLGEYYVSFPKLNKVIKWDQHVLKISTKLNMLCAASSPLSNKRIFIPLKITQNIKSCDHVASISHLVLVLLTTQTLISMVQDRWMLSMQSGEKIAKADAGVLLVVVTTSVEEFTLYSVMLLIQLPCTGSCSGQLKNK